MALCEQDLINVPYEVITDKSIQNNDETFKLIIIGDTGKPVPSG